MHAAATIDDLLAPLIAFRRDLHANPELGFAEHRTAERIAAALAEIGLEVHRGIGGTGLVGGYPDGTVATPHLFSKVAVPGVCTV